jgi:hypothetical protein
VELAVQLNAEGWYCGFLKAGFGDRAIAAIAAANTRALLVVDYAEAHFLLALPDASDGLSMANYHATRHIHASPAAGTRSQPARAMSGSGHDTHGHNPSVGRCRAPASLRQAGGDGQARGLLVCAPGTRLSADVLEASADRVSAPPGTGRQPGSEPALMHGPAPVSGCEPAAGRELLSERRSL